MKLNKIIILIFCSLLLLHGISSEDSDEFQITTDLNDQLFPSIHGDIVVWEDDRNGNSDIYGYNLSTNQEFQITDNLDMICHINHIICHILS